MYLKRYLNYLNTLNYLTILLVGGSWTNYTNADCTVIITVQMDCCNKKHNIYLKYFVFCQSFREAVFYNRETRVFEVCSDATRSLARQVKVAVRLGKKRNSELYRAVLNNSFSPISVVPILEASPQVKPLSTIYTVQVSLLTVR